MNKKRQCKIALSFLIHYEDFNSRIRYGELKRSISKITDKMLSNQLKELVRDEIIYKQVYQEIPLKVEYSLTEYGKSLIPIMEMLYHWGKESLTKMSTEIIDDNKYIKTYKRN